MNANLPPGQIFVIGDSHIGLGHGAEAPVTEWLERLAALKPRSLYLNGDVFHYLIAVPKFRTSSIEKVMAKLRELVDRGIGVHYVEGNRDFFVSGSYVEESVTDTAPRYSVTAGGKKYLIIHGDMINDRDWPYRFWRAVSKNPLMRFGLRLVPGGLARRFVDRVEKRLARSNFKHKTRLPLELMEAYGRQRAAEGFTHVVFGHFHHKLVLPAGQATVAVLPAWYEKREAMMIAPDTGEFHFVEI
ncbi:MAG TPA: UDP-2,3-diacylglucosamine diphosphatase [Thermoanaerobaculia bacterium]|nr:UDP-2,3-diacylglucosamine diphosphatase [Thermoanaerobaculia bacterium]